jgi:hypothetical protein
LLGACSSTVQHIRQCRCRGRHCVTRLANPCAIPCWLTTIMCLT